MIEVDADLCLTCRECEVACSLYHEGLCAPSLSRIDVSYDDFTAGAPRITVCRQCDWPACVYACAALWDTPALRIDAATGARVIDPELCRGCGACVRACPLSAEHPVIGLKTVDRQRVYFKCDLCYDRPAGPACVDICPGGALSYVPASERRR